MDKDKDSLSRMFSVVYQVLNDCGVDWTKGEVRELDVLKFLKELEARGYAVAEYISLLKIMAMAAERIAWSRRHLRVPLVTKEEFDAFIARLDNPADKH